MKDILLAVWRYRHFVTSSVVNEMRARFARSKLGATWVILQPLTQAVIYAVVFSQVLGARMPGVSDRYAYGVYLLAGILGWSLFSEILSRSINVFVDNAQLLRKIVFPRMCLPVIVAGTALVNAGLLFIAIFAVLLVLGHLPGPQVLWLPFLAILVVALGLGLGIFLGVLNVFVRDVAQTMVVVLQIWFWMTPVVYFSAVLPAGFRKVLEFNPMFPVIVGFQNVVVFNKPPPFADLAWVAALAVALLGVSLFVFRRASNQMVDVL
ncbi:ABC transporter permease [Dyella soli]|uniref:Transport permease protein n=1 Tax=Dyella soli TaxID=522319 RepID=A0A4R0YVX7_9GAMM|nr:ABC transporter permease [Dyella soli]TCI11133.1 ABC transporter permease [Dyella soli]